MSKRTRLIPLFLLLATLLALAGCSALGEATATPGPETFKSELLFTSEIAFTGEENTIISLFLLNSSVRRFPGDDNFQGRMEIRDATSNELRAAAEVYQVGPLEAGEKRTQLIWEGVMEPGAYILSWGAQNYSFTSTQFEVPR
jgi:hypothetical protein